MAFQCSTNFAYGKPHLISVYICTFIHTHMLCYAMLSHFSRVRLCATPQTVAQQAPPSLGFSRQEHWSGLPFPSPMHESEKWKWGRSVVSDPQRPHWLQPSRLLRPWDFPGKSTGVGCHCLLHICVYLWLIHVEVWQKTTKFCKAIILQLKNKLIKNKWSQ